MFFSDNFEDRLPIIQNRQTVSMWIKTPSKCVEPLFTKHFSY